MRITNKIMQNNSLTNLNNNKILQDKLNTQVSTEKKITRPSDDPVIAIRALRLRTNLSEVTQYLDKNVSDASGWITGTEDALSTMNDVLQSMYSQCQKGNDGTMTSETRATILEQLKSLRDEVYATGDADYAGRTLFTGYRTNEKLRFQSNTENDNYRITQNFTTDSLSTMTYVDSGSLNTIKDADYKTGGAGNATTEQAVSTSSIARIQLAYDQLDSVTAGTNDPTLTINGNPVDMTAVSSAGISVEVTDADGNTTTQTLNPYQIMEAVNAGSTVKNSADNTITYDKDTAIYIPETGEILLSNEQQADIQSDKDTKISVEYEKSTWEKGDLRPEHYFKCTEKIDGKTLDYSGETQLMEYDLGYNQKLQVNTLASDVFTHDIGRTVDELVQTSQDVVDMEATIATLNKMVGDDSYDQDKVTESLEAANKSLTLLKDKEKKLYGSGMTAMQGYMAQTNLAVTDLGTRDARLSLIKSRLTSQQTTFKGLVTENEGADVTEVAVQLKSAETAYDAALLATSKIVQNSLMKYI